MRLILIRHAEAAPGNPDEQRPLTPAGHATARELADRLAAVQPDAVVSSPLRRALETARPIAAATGLDPQADDRLAPGATLDDLRAAVAGRGDTVVAVGHEPDCGHIVHALTGRETRFAPGAHAELEL